MEMFDTFLPTDEVEDLILQIAKEECGDVEQKVMQKYKDEVKRVNDLFKQYHNKAKEFTEDQIKRLEKYMKAKMEDLEHMIERTICEVNRESKKKSDILIAVEKVKDDSLETKRNVSKHQKEMEMKLSKFNQDIYERV